MVQELETTSAIGSTFSGGVEAEPRHQVYVPHLLKFILDFSHEALERGINPGVSC
jgi:hypothetical protein